MKDISGLTPKQQRFVREYLIDFNAAGAAVRAGYSTRTARSQGSRLLTNVNIQAALEKAMQDRNDKLEIDARYVLEQARKVHERCMQEVRPVRDKFGVQVFDAAGNALFSFNANAALRALEIIGRHVDIQAFRERVGFDDDGLPEMIIHDPSADENR